MGSSSRVPVLPSGARVSTEAAKPRLSLPDTSTKPPLPPASPPRERMRAPEAAVVSLSDQTVTRPPSAPPRPLASMVLPPKRTVRSVEVSVTSPPRAWSAPRASMVPICPTRSPSIVTWPGAAPRSAADTSIVPEFVTAPATTPAGRTAPLAVATAVASSPPISRTTPPWLTLDPAPVGPDAAVIAHARGERTAVGAHRLARQRTVHRESDEAVAREIHRELLAGRERHGPQLSRNGALVHHRRGGERDEAAGRRCERALIDDGPETSRALLEDVA